jgi:16S rRNA C1402 (ribose-2'-O) methylase RsmI
MLFLISGGVAMSGVSRGLRNNNAGNIRCDNKTNWLGQVGADDKGFIIFESPEYGIRAMTRVLQSYQRRGVVTLGDIIATWAPAIENNVEAYIKSVESQTGFKRSQVMFVQNYPELIAAIIKHENGSQPYAMALIYEGVALA